MPIPVILGGAALFAAGKGIQKGLNAKEKNRDAKDIIRYSKRAFNEMKDDLELERDSLNRKLEDYGILKITIFSTIIDNMLKILSKCVEDEASSKLFNQKIFSQKELIELKKVVLNAEEISSDIASGIASGATIAMGAYGGVGVLATASTGTAISSLGGVAATNATLAWLGGGSLATGGMGMAGGMVVLGGLVSGPAIAIAGFVMDSKAEENLTKAYDFESKVSVNIEKMKKSKEEFVLMSYRIDELKQLIYNFTSRYKIILDSLDKERTIFDKIRISFNLEPKIATCKLSSFGNLLLLGKGVKSVLDIPLIDVEGNTNFNFKEEIEEVKISYLGKGN